VRTIDGSPSSLLAIYQKGHRTDKSVKVVVFYSEAELAKVQSVLSQLGLEKDPSVVLIDAPNDNTQSASNVRRSKPN
jgi:hypothetical protein